MAEQPSGPVAGAVLRVEVSLGRASFAGEGAGMEVLAAFEAFRSFFAEHRDALPDDGLGSEDSAGESGEAAGARGGNGASDSAGAASDSVDGSPSTQLPLKAYLSQKALKGNHQVALGIAVWAARRKNEYALTIVNFEDYWKSSGKKVPANIGRDVRKCVTEGWIEEVNKEFKVTAFGEDQYDKLPATEK